MKEDEMEAKVSVIEHPPKRQPGLSNFTWLKQQALDKETLDAILMIERDEKAFHQEGIVTQGSEEIVLRLKQGIFHTTRATGHSIANVFVQIFKGREHMLSPDFMPGDDEMTLVDIGANEGYYAVSMATNSKARIISIEPNPIAYGLLTKNIKANEIDNIETINCAVWTSSGTADFSILPQVTSIGTMSLTESSFMSSAQKRIVHVPVRTMTLQDVISSYELSRIDILKIDIEGGELEMLEANKESLAIVDRVVVEYHSQELKKAVTELLAANGFELALHSPDRADFGDLYFLKK